MVPVAGWTVGSLSRGQPSRQMVTRELQDVPPPVAVHESGSMVLKDRDSLSQTARGLARSKPAVGSHRVSVAQAREATAAARMLKHKVRDVRVLNRRSVQPATEKKYSQLLKNMSSFVYNAFHLDLHVLSPGHQLDLAFTEFVNGLFWDGESLATATASWAALGWMFPDVSRFGAVAMPLSRQALAGFAKEAPPQTRLALPVPVASALIAECAAMGYLRAARAMLVGMAAFLRPGELAGLTCQQLIPPSLGGMTTCWSIVMHPRELNISSKTGQFNDSVLLDGPDSHLLGLACRALVRDRSRSDTALGLTMPQHTAMFRRAVEQLQLSSLHPVPYQLRHTGASRELVLHQRPLAEVKRKGRWFSDRSLQRYLKGGRTAEQFESLPKALRRVCLSSHEAIGSRLSLL